MSDLTSSDAWWDPYATYGPNDGSGESWHEYFERLRAEREEGVEEDDAYDPIVLKTIRSADLSGIIPQVSRLYQKALQTSETTSCGRSWAFLPGRVFKSGEREGEYRPDRLVEQWWLYAIYDGHLLQVTYARDDTWFEFGTARCVNRQLGWQGLSDKQVKELVASGHIDFD